MGSQWAWHHVLDQAAPGRHVAHLYTDVDFLGRAVARFAGTGLRAGEAVIAIATVRHWRSICRRLEADGVDVDALQDRGQLVVLDAEDTLATCMVDGMPQGERFRAVIDRVIGQVRAAGYPRVRAFGEMVDLLCRTNVAATIELERLWNDLLSTSDIALLCGYRLDPFDRALHRGLLQHVSHAHSDLIPVEDYARLDRAVDRAYAEIFGGGTDASRLRHALLQHYTRPAAMPDGAAAIFAAREFVPDAAAALLASARRHYTTYIPTDAAA